MHSSSSTKCICAIRCELVSEHLGSVIITLTNNKMLFFVSFEMFNRTLKLLLRSDTQIFPQLEIKRIEISLQSVNWSSRQGKDYRHIISKRTNQVKDNNFMCPFIETECLN